jgi:hypothetical protein
VAAVVAVAGVVGGTALLGSRDSGGDPTGVADDVTSTPTSPGEPASTPRVESWRDISVMVPASWGYGSLDDWCANDGRLKAPVVERPGGASVDILCDPQLGYGVQFSDGAAFDAAVPPGEVWEYTRGEVQMYPKGAWLGYQRSDNAMVFVSAPTRAEAEQVLGSFVHHTDLERHGCALEMGTDLGERSLPGDGELRLCRYAIDGWLEQSEILTGQDAADALAALEEAPLKGDRMCTAMVEGSTVVVTAADAEGQVTLDACQGFSWAGQDHNLTSDVLFWVLSPGWTGGVEGDVPLPEQLRQ